MKKRTVTLALVTTLGLGTLGTALSPALADTATGGRATKIKDALKGLVSDGTLTQAQADKVAETLDQQLPKGGPGFGPGRHPGHGPGAHLEDAADVLGLTPAQVRTALEGGKSLLDLAQEKGVSKDKLVAALVGDAKARLAARVKAGELTQAEADSRLKELTARVEDLVTRKGLPERGFRHDQRGPGAPAPDGSDGPPVEGSSLQG